MRETRSCFGILVDEELPEGWEDLPYEEKFEADRSAKERARERWKATHPGMHHDDDLWEKR